VTGKTEVRTLADGSKAWYRDGQLHRDDGPALEWADGYKEWYRDGQRVPASSASPR
jgi:hypothetical protein